MCFFVLELKRSDDQTLFILILIVRIFFFPQTLFEHMIWNDGTCWMKQGGATKDDARETGDTSMVCGVKE